jgi:hypothetical protein
VEKNKLGDVDEKYNFANFQDPQYASLGERNHQSVSMKNYGRIRGTP